jgi:hypothetical protein
MAEENVAALPEDLQTEARNLQQRTLRGMNALESYRRRTIRPSNFTGRANYLGRYDNRRGPDSDTRTTEKKTIPHLSPKYMIDAESLSCILAVLFVNDNGIQQRKLHMILKNFAMHGSTCNWLINSLLDIIHRSTNNSSSSQETSYIVPNWLSLKLEASMRLLFEISNLRTATPATVSRAGILFLNASDLGWNPIVTSWIDTREVQAERASNFVISKTQNWLRPVLQIFRAEKPARCYK